MCMQGPVVDTRNTVLHEVDGPCPHREAVEQLVQQSRLVHASISSSVNGDNGITYLREL